MCFAVSFILFFSHLPPQRHKQENAHKHCDAVGYRGRPSDSLGAAASLQEAAVTSLKFKDDYYRDLLKKYTEKRDLFLKGFDDIGLRHTVPQGAYYVLLDISEFGYASDLEFCKALAQKVGVGAVTGSSFFREPVNNLIRLHFAKKNRRFSRR